MEPFKIKLIEPVNILTKKERLQILQEASYNLFRVPSEKVTIDLLTDSGTGALSQEQLAMLMKGDESYASAKSWQRFNEAVKKFSGRRFVIPVHQGRAAEKILAETFLNKSDIILSNSLFDTTRANFEHRETLCLDLPIKKALNLENPAMFKGNIDLQKLKAHLKKYKKRVKLIVMTLTNNSGGGQPASIKNIEAVSILARRNSIPFLIDACRIAENSYFIWKDEMKNKGEISTIIRKTFAFSDLAYMSAKKDGLANSGGFITTNNRNYFENLGNLAILYEGYLTYGGMSGREMETVAQGLNEVTDKNYLEYRIGQVEYLHQKLSALGVPLISPPGGHAVYIDAAKLLPHIPREKFPGQALVVAIYLEGGIRAVEIGSLMFGKDAKNELVRLALPRRVYTQSHLDYVVDIFQKIFENRKKLKGFEITRQPKSLRHFSCHLKPKNL